MRRLSDLIKGLHPADVPSVSLGSLMTRIRERGKDDESVAQVYVVSNTQGMVRAEDYRENTIHSEDTSNYTVIRPGMIAYNPSRLNIGSIAMLKNDEPGLVSPMYVVFSIDQSKVEKEYFELLMKSSYVASRIDALKEEGARFRFDFTRWDFINVPLPSKTVQQEVVNTLNVLQDLINSLKSELDARKKQYEYYRDEFFGKNYDEMLKRCQQNNVKIIALEELGEFTRGKRFVRNDIKEDGIPCIHYGDLYTYYGVSAEKTKCFLDEELAKKMRFAQKGDVVIVQAGENDMDIGIGVAWLGDEDVAIHDACYIFKHNINPKYISYFLRTNVYHLQIKKYVSTGKICSIPAKNIGKALIPVPALDEQQRVVDILDQFDALCNDISTGLPAEIEARTKQYEYYRDKLLAFKELS